MTVSVVTALLEAGWTWLYHDEDPVWTLGNNFNLDLGLAPAWKILGLGLAVAAVTFVRQAPRQRAVDLDAHKAGSSTM